jgi:2-polyprenyl-6-methoxyphenol hydroxylase-like FAD-dependent oxidoreductase
MATWSWAAAHVAPAAEAASRRDIGAFRQEWRRVLPAAADLMERVSSFDDLLVNTVRQVDCRRWFSGRLVFARRRGPRHCPDLGQGANSALVDGVVLAEELAGVPSVALAGYDKHRRPPVRHVQKTAGLVQRLCGIEQVTALRLRTLSWRDWPGSRGSVGRASVGPNEPAIARESHSGRHRPLQWP